MQMKAKLIKFCYKAVEEKMLKIYDGELKIDLENGNT